MVDTSPSKVNSQLSNNATILSSIYEDVIRFGENRFGMTWLKTVVKTLPLNDSNVQFHSKKINQSWLARFNSISYDKDNKMSWLLGLTIRLDISHREYLCEDWKSIFPGTLTRSDVYVILQYDLMESESYCMARLTIVPASIFTAELAKPETTIFSLLGDPCILDNTTFRSLVSLFENDTRTFMFPLMKYIILGGFSKYAEYVHTTLGTNSQKRINCNNLWDCILGTSSSKAYIRISVEPLEFKKVGVSKSVARKSFNDYFGNSISSFCQQLLCNGNTVITRLHKISEYITQEGTTEARLERLLQWIDILTWIRTTTDRLLQRLKSEVCSLNPSYRFIEKDDPIDETESDVCIERHCTNNFVEMHIMTWMMLYAISPQFKRPVFGTSTYEIKYSPSNVVNHVYNLLYTRTFMTVVSDPESALSQNIKKVLEESQVEKRKLKMFSDSNLNNFVTFIYEREVGGDVILYFCNLNARNRTKEYDYDLLIKKATTVCTLHQTRFHFLWINMQSFASEVRVRLKLPFEKPFQDQYLDMYINMVHLSRFFVLSPLLAAYLCFHDKEYISSIVTFFTRIAENIPLSGVTLVDCPQNPEQAKTMELEEKLNFVVQDPGKADISYSWPLTRDQDYSGFVQCIVAIMDPSPPSNKKRKKK